MMCPHTAFKYLFFASLCLSDECVWQPNGLVMAMYNDVAGFVHTDELHLSTAHKSLSEVFKCGQVFKARVLGVDTRYGSAKLSLRVSVLPQTQM